MFVKVFQKFENPVNSLLYAKLYDGSGTEVDGNVLEEVMKQPDVSVFKLTLDTDARGAGFQVGHFNVTFDMLVLSTLCVLHLP